MSGRLPAGMTWQRVASTDLGRPRRMYRLDLDGRPAALVRTNRAGKWRATTAGNALLGVFDTSTEAARAAIAYAARTVPA